MIKLEKDIHYVHLDFFVIFKWF